MLAIDNVLKIGVGNAINISNMMFGLDCKIYEPNEDSIYVDENNSIYDDENQETVYKDDFDYSGKALIVGLNQIRFDAEDPWTPSDVRLFWKINSEDEYAPSDQA